MWMGEEEPTGKLRWLIKNYVHKILQQEWIVIDLDTRSIHYEWRDVPIVKEER